MRNPLKENYANYYTRITTHHNPYSTPKSLILNLVHTLEGTPTVEARKLEHQYPHGLKVKYRGSQH